MISRYPSFRFYSPSNYNSSYIKSCVKSKSTKAELALRRCLRQAGFRYKTSNSNIFGKPDIIIPHKIAIFCDGDFWHGRNWQKLRKRLLKRANFPYWSAKILANRERDREVNKNLLKDGWFVIRLWESDILSSSTNIKGRCQI